jgi:hypothetical protein
MMAQKYTNEEFIKLSKQIFGDDLDYSKTIYKNSRSNVILICKIHGEFVIKAGHHLSYKRSCQICSGSKHNRQSFIEKAISIHGDKYCYDLVEFTKVKDPVKIICPIHGKFSQTPDKHINAGNGCQKCDVSCKKDIDYVIEMGNKIHNNFYNYNKAIYHSSYENICITCPLHGDFWQAPSNHIHGKAGCPDCYSENRCYTQQEIINKCIEIHGSKYDYSKLIYTSSKDKIEIICPKHGSFWQNCTAHTHGANCPKCVGRISKKK